MPEGPELHLTMLSINKLCKDVVFNGKVVRNPIHKSAEVTWDEERYTIRAESRGKELMLHLQASDNTETHGENTSLTGSTRRAISILFTFGMSGKFAFTPAQVLLKHSHLSFFTTSSQTPTPAMALSFVDPRRFGKWVVGGTWSTDRGPCVIQEYDSFVKHIIANVDSAAFRRPVCEVLLDQQLFNGIGNYLRAEILYRCKVPPFVEAESVLQFQDGVQLSTSKYFREERSSKLTFDMLTPKAQELLQLCHMVPLEVVNLGSSKYTLLDLTADDDNGLFASWLQCYNQTGMKSLTDHKKRTIWFSGPAGPLAPTEQTSQKAKASKKTKPASKVKTEVNKVSQNVKEELAGETPTDGILLDSTQSIKPKRTKPAGRSTNQKSSISGGESQIVDDNTELTLSTSRKRLQKKNNDEKVDEDVKKVTVLEEDNAFVSTRLRSTRKVKL